MDNRLPDRRNGRFAWSDPRVGAAFDDASFDGTIWRRSVAFLIDCAIMVALFVLLMVFNLLTLFLLSGLVALLWPALLFVIYDTVLLGGRGGATIGMRLMGVRMVNLQGEAPGYLQALVVSVLFYLSVTLTSGLVLLVPFFTDKARCLHDIVAGVFVINAAAPKAQA